MEIEVGDYVRTEQWGIAKVHKVDNGKVTWIKNKNNRATHYFTQLGEPSKNIIGLIKKDDYVNGYKVDFVEDNWIVYNRNHPKYINILADDIKSIVTKEQFESMEYKVGEE